MSADPQDDRLFLDTVTVAGVLVLPGEPFPADFYALYPNAFRLPARLIWRDDVAGDGAPPDAATQKAQGTEQADSAPDDAPGPPESPPEPVSEPPPPNPAASDPVARFLSINDALARRSAEP